MKTRLPASADIEYFLEVANCLHISRAAERLGITQPSLSVSIQRLEDLIGATLLVRTRAGVQLTPAGELLVRRGQNLKQEWEGLLRETSKNQSEISGRYTLGAHPSVALYSWNNVLPKLLGEFSELEFKMDHDLSRKITESVISFKVDFAVVINPVAHPDLVMKKLAEDDVTFWVARSGHTNVDTLIYDDQLLQTNELLKKLRATQFKRSLVSGNLEVVASLTANGAGVGILPGRVAQQSIHSGLKKFSGNWPVFKDHIYFIYRKDLQNSSAAQRLAKTLYESLTKLF
jgi:LysR family transcriptional regulator, cell division regulator